MLKIVTITGPSCAGKTTLARELLNTGDFCEIVSYTSRKPREGEVEGRDYYFRDMSEILKMITDKETVESAEFKGNIYATSRAEIDAKLASGKIPLVIVEPHGLRQLLNIYGKYNTPTIGVSSGGVYPVYIDGPRSMLVERFLRRFIADRNADPEYYISRINSMLDELDQWAALCPRNMTISLFTESNKESIVNSLRNVIKEAVKRD
jgi:guanylate kinase